MEHHSFCFKYVVVHLVVRDSFTEAKCIAAFRELYDAQDFLIECASDSTQRYEIRPYSE